MSFEAANITNISTYMEEIRSNNKYNYDQRNLYDRRKKNKCNLINASDKKRKLTARKSEASASE